MLGSEGWVWQGAGKVEKSNMGNRPSVGILEALQILPRSRPTVLAKGQKYKGKA